MIPIIPYGHYYRVGGPPKLCYVKALGLGSNVASRLCGLGVSWQKGSLSLYMPVTLGFRV